MMRQRTHAAQACAVPHNKHEQRVKEAHTHLRCTQKNANQIPSANPTRWFPTQPYTKPTRTCNHGISWWRCAVVGSRYSHCQRAWHASMLMHKRCTTYKQQLVHAVP
jgi:hypothetical protein